ncbi:hypothetical protein GUITHDRAFT_155206 [Guillardia theta CCMP2712]|uniref:Uncharacterized protein n=1 Tax=Guillardia theta (strain CCMP2712) TaxID=905079 RepID=L1IL07_GUITC|nr:hypothetical protein GUITHDRAFT_155206 [Guillardia theta CCMP2712]EKX36599.1 hypothetical protein GUITHDRAFT_155206 [Guillardia theta CCMP2712]|eukprot:XP_005823579.1 hypothetical protein GUITHDRAFT_155206 [Guillardia theta CCMP2712]
MTQPNFKKRRTGNHLSEWKPGIALRQEDDLQLPNVAALRKTSLLFNELRSEVYNVLRRRHNRFETERAISKQIAERNPLTQKSEASDTDSNPHSPETETVDQNARSNKVTPNLHPIPVCVKGLEVEPKDADNKNGISYMCVEGDISTELPPISL